MITNKNGGLDIPFVVYNGLFNLHTDKYFDYSPLKRVIVNQMGRL